jgi:16S rRNA processing protein RimM
MSPVRSSSGPVDGTGSSGVDEPVFVAIGKLRRPHGVHGEIIMDVYTDFPERLRPGMQLFAGEARQPLRLTRRRWHQDALLMTFEGFDTPESVGTFRNQVLVVRTADLPPLPEGDYYHHQLIGLQVVDEAGKFLGTVTEILETGANDVLVVRPEIGSEILLPMIDQVVLEIALQDRQIRVHLLPGILDEAVE